MVERGGGEERRKADLALLRVDLLWGKNHHCSRLKTGRYPQCKVNIQCECKVSNFTSSVKNNIFS